MIDLQCGRSTLDNREAEGYNIQAVEAWVANNIQYLTPPFEWTRLRRAFKLDILAARRER